MSEAKYPVKRGGEYDFDIDKLAFGGAGIARVDNYVVFIKDTLPGDKVKARITRRKPSFAEARLLEIIKPSPMRQHPPCKYHQWCGGCTWQNLSYENQVKIKRQLVEESIQHIAGIQKSTVCPVIESDSAFAYRNKMEFSFTDKRWLLPEELGKADIKPGFALGLHVPGTFDKIIKIDHCLLQSDTANRILRSVSDFCMGKKLQAYGLKTHQGLLRFLVIRQSRYNGKIMVNIVTAYEEENILKQLALKLTEEFPEVESVVNNINSRPAQIARGEREIVLAGKSYIQEKLGDFIFNISANSFFQTNSAQAEKMYKKVLEFSELSGKEFVWDLYCGTGTFSLFLAAQAKKITGFDVEASAIQDAAENARNHQVFNAGFIEGDLLHTLASVKEKPDVIITDPPRAGMHEKVVRLILSASPRRLVYISCNPATLARDLNILSEQYAIDKVQPLDMFPQTYHIETIVQLTKRSVDFVR
ncbi:MAG: 23S rRNA (uracil(1939)-C(5))-methyltransferase RlmD [Calditrichaceae bacterium]|nr:23S rRNA (uracil(1939)-C(5))-methyltransferase RlmD [Calditrichaceae bacterium]RQV96073.1 MAG: 23S rRNA (uracil(1939)-C(5))-methyltransferase RlmD [Calditrichota bacterium]